MPSLELTIVAVVFQVKYGLVLGVALEVVELVVDDVAVLELAGVLETVLLDVTELLALEITEET